MKEKTSLRLISFAIGLPALGYLFYTDWTLALAIMLLMWGNNLMLEAQK